jgi:predicted transcriptional regulator
MAAAAPNLVLLDRPMMGEGLDLASELFHRINRVIPEHQQLLVVPPSCPVRAAVELMCRHGYSQLPVVQNGEVLGVFSYRSFSKEAATTTLDSLNRQGCAPGDLPVDEFLEKFQFANVTEEMSRVFNAMDRDNGILVGAPDRLIGILAPMDFLTYLYQVAGPFVMVSEIELALRALIRCCLSESEIAFAAKRCLGASTANQREVPETLEEMTFENYRLLISHGETWPRFQDLFGGTRNRVSGKLKEVSAIRNDLFKREITVRD